MDRKSPEEQKQLVLEAFETLFNKRDYAKAATFWSENYLQHSAHIEPGRDGLFNLIRRQPNTLRYGSYSTNEDWLTRDQLANVFETIGSAVPDLCWTIEDIQTFRHQIVVRGEATGTPVREFWGAKPTGKSFKTMAIDIFTVKDGKLASAYHVENWMTALQHISK